MASSKTPRMCILPGSQITVTALDRVDGNSKINIMDMMDTVTIATMEEFQGFGAWFTKPFCQLWMPPVLPESFSDQELKTQLEQKRRVVEFYHMVFNNANRDLEPANDANCELDRSVYLPLLYADGNHGGLMVDLLVQALTTFEFDCPFHVLKEVVVVGKGSAVEDLLTILDAQLKEIALAVRPNPGEIHVAYLPASEEGFKVCRLLWVAFKFRLTFFWERISNLIMWNVDHKTSVNDDSPQNPGYPDHDYLRNVTDKLAKMGITEKFMQGFSIPF